MKNYIRSLDEKQFLVILIIIAVVVRLFAIIVVGDNSFENEFGTLVKNLLNGNGYSYYSVNQNGEVLAQYLKNPKKVLPSNYMPPGYPFFLAGFSYLFGTEKGGIHLIEIIQAIMGTLSIFILLRIYMYKFDKTVARISSLLAVLYPMLVLTSSQISPVNLYLFFNILVVYFLFQLEKEGKYKYSILAGLFMGLLVLSRGQTILYVPFFVIWMIYFLKNTDYKKISTFIFIVILIITPWSIRNYSKFGKLTPLPFSGGLNLWQGNNRHATGTRSEYTEPGFSITVEMHKKIAKIRHINRYELKKDNIYKTEAVDFILNNPGKFALLSFKKLIYYWGYYWGINFKYPGAKSPFYWLPWFFTLPFFIIGLIISIKHYNKYIVFYLYFLISTCIVMLFFVIPRYRIFVLPWVFPFAINGFIYTKNNLFSKTV